jgi:hypothetical protein
MQFKKWRNDMTISTTRHNSQFGAMLGILLICAILVGCSVPVVRVQDPQVASASMLSFIRDGVTTREEIRTKLNLEPTTRFEKGRIEIYKVKLNPPENICSLVLVFGPNGILTKHSIVVTE